jgi:hypothetical protein
MSEPLIGGSSPEPHAPVKRSGAIALPPAAWAALGVVIAALFTCISSISTALVPEIGQFVRQALAQPAAPTVIPSALSAPPKACITSPLYTDGPTPVQTSVTVVYDSIPEGEYLWVVVRIPKVKPNWKVYPQLLNGIPKPVTGKGEREVLVQLGSVDKDVGEPFNIVVLLLDEKANQTFVDYSEKCIDPNIRACDGIDLPASGAEILDFSTLTRK